MANYHVPQSLESFDGEYQAAAPVRAGIDSLSDGDHDFTIVEASFDQINGKEVLRLGLQTGGRVVERVYWFDEQRNINALGADLVSLGFDADKWTAAHGRKLSVELPKAVAKLTGVRFRGSKRSRPGTGQYQGRTFHDLYINGRIGAAAPMPATAAPPFAGGPAPAPANDRQPAAAGTGAARDSGVPF